MRKTHFINISITDNARNEQQWTTSIARWKRNAQRPPQKRRAIAIIGLRKAANHKRFSKASQFSACIYSSTKCKYCVVYICIITICIIYHLEFNILSKKINELYRLWIYMFFFISWLLIDQVTSTVLNVISCLRVCKSLSFKWSFLK